MPANEFERRVQGQLDDFELNPSASVWKKIEEQIKKKKRRRAIAFFFLVAALLTGGYFAYYLLQPGKKANTSHHISTSQEQNNISNDKSNPAATTNQSLSQQKLHEKDQTAEPLAPSKQPGTKISVPNSQQAQFDVSSANPAIAHKNGEKKIKQDILPVTDQPKKNTSSSLQKNGIVQAKPEIAIKVETPGTTTKEPKEAPAKSNKTVDGNNRLDIAVREPVIAKPDSANSNEIVHNTNKQIQLPKRKYRIKWGIDFSVGMSSNQGQLFTVNKAADRAYALNSSVSSTGASVFAIPASPSSIKPGAAFSIGLSSELQLSPRSRLSTGLQYAYTSNHIRKGGVVYALLPVQNNFAATRTVDQVYHGAPQNSYTNSYHFLSLPLAYHWQISRSKKLPIEWNMGLSFSYLLSTNALLFNSSYGGIYYQDKAAINKMHINLGTGISFRLRSKNGMEWTIGPEISFDTRKLVNNSTDSPQYLLFTGINTKLYFGHRMRKAMQNSSGD